MHHVSDFITLLTIKILTVSCKQLWS